MNKFNWLVRRELWESRSVWIVPLALGALIVACVLVPALLTGSVSLEGLGPDGAAKVHERMTPDNLDGAASLALGLIAAVFMIVVSLMQYLYACDALYGERRDRSILFWKSLPLSDADTVLSKLFIAAVAMPLAAAAVAVVTQVLVFAIFSAKLGSIELLQGHLWSPSLWGGSLLVMVYLLVASALWYLPVIGWCLLVSAWAPRSPLMYSLAVPFGISLAELIVFRHAHVSAVIWQRFNLVGLLSHALGGHRADGSDMLEINEQHTHIARLVDGMRPAQFFSSPEVWAGVVVGALLIAAAIWFRRTRAEAA